MSMLLVSTELFEPWRSAEATACRHAPDDLVARQVLDGRADQRTFGAIDIAVRRNAFGRQVDSFEADLRVAGLAEVPLPTPCSSGRRSWKRSGRGSRSWPRSMGHPVACRQGHVLVTAFHPELRHPDRRVHELFLALIT